MTAVHAPSLSHETFVEPFSTRMLARLPVSPLVSGIGWFLALGVAFLLMELATGRWPVLTAAEPPERLFGDVRLIVVLHLLFATGPMGTLYFTRQARRTLRAVSPLIAVSPEERDELESTVGRYPRFWLRLAGCVGIVAVLPGPWLVLPPELAWQPANWTPEIAWQHLLVPPIGWWGVRNLYMQSYETHRVTFLADRLERVDLFDLSSLTPFSQQGLVHVLLMATTLAILSPTLIGIGTTAMFFGVGAFSLTFGVGTYVNCLRGVQRRVRAAKEQALEGVTAALTTLHAEGPISSSPEKLSRAADLLAYQQEIHRVGEWTLDGSRLSRLVLYLLLPLGSWMGAAVVERLVDRLLG